MTKSKIAIVGAGIGGLAAALAIQDTFDFAIFEQSGGLERVGAGINMTPNAMAVLQGLGLGDEVRQLGCSPNFRVSRNWDDGHETLRISGDNLQAKYGHRQYMLHRADLLKILASRIDRRRVHFKKRVVEILERPGFIELTFADGTRYRADVLIGADGIHSRSRELFFGRDDPHFAGAVAFRGIIPIERLPNRDLRPFTKWWGPNYHHEVVTFLISAGLEFTFAAIRPESGWRHESWSMAGDVEDLRASFGQYHEEVREVLAACDSVGVTALHERDPIPQWTTKRLALLGDAAHPMMPFMAQGAATGLEDAVVLGRCLRTIPDVPEALHRYQLTRHPRTSSIQLGSRRNDWLRDQAEADWLFGYDAWTSPIV